MTRFALILGLSLIFSIRLKAQTDTIVKKDSIDYYELSLEQLISVKAHGVPSELEELINSLIAVASKKPLSTRESPSIVSLITEEEIRLSGARDLIDVLRLVPGFDFGVDVEGVIGLGTRGNWAHEGKVLLLIDGQEMNETLFATTQFGNHFPVDIIKKIEIIRGPGSAIYGGFAEYGVINIITRSGSDLNGIQAKATYGKMAFGGERKNLSLSAGGKKGEAEFSLSAYGGHADRSDREFTDIYGTAYNLKGSSDLNPSHINLGASYKGLSFRAIADLYQISTRVAYDTVGPSVFYESFNSYHNELKYTHQAGSKLTITPRLTYKREEPWKTKSTTGIDEYHKITDKYTANVTASWNLSRKINIVFGSEAFRNDATDLVAGSSFSNGETNVSYYNVSGFAQGLFKHRIVNVILGARYDQHNAYGAAFVPRLGLTKRHKKTHFKFLYSNSFRAPSIENINLQDSTGIKPEKTSVLELEAGYQLTRRSIITLNFFDINTFEPIVYYVTPELEDAYRNFGKAGTRGFEAEFRHKEKWGHILLNYSFYSVKDKEKVADYEVPDDPSMLLAFPSHKANLFASYLITPSLSVNPSVSFLGERYAYTSVDSLDNSIIEKLEPQFLINLYVNYDNLFLKGLSLGVGVFDILNQGVTFIQPYNGYHTPLPGPSRELVFKLGYSFNRNKK